MSFYDEHGQRVASVGPTVRAVESEVAALASPPTEKQLARLSEAAQMADAHVDEARSGWNVNESSEEEEFSTIETQLSEGAVELKNAMAALVTYAGNPSAATFAPYTTHIRSGREKWNEGVVQLWHVLKRRAPPTL